MKKSQNIDKSPLGDLYNLSIYCSNFSNNLIGKNNPNWLALHRPTYEKQELTSILLRSSHKKLETLFAMHPITKFTAAKLLILLNLPAILLFAGAFEIGSSVLA